MEREFEKKKSHGRAIPVTRHRRSKFFNDRLKVLVEEYLIIDKTEDLYWHKYKIGEISVEVLSDTLKSLEANRKTAISRMSSTMRRMMSDDLTIENVMAIEICNAASDAIIEVEGI